MNRKPHLDGLRSFGFFLILLYHTSNLTHDPNAFQDFMKTGWNGIFLFLTLTGYLLGGLLFKELQTSPNIDLKNFWGRRLLRTWPLYFLAVGFFAIKGHVGLAQLWPYLTFTQNINLGEKTFFVSSWTLAVQMQFYLAIPLLIFAQKKWQNPKAWSATYLMLVLLGFGGFYWQRANTEIGSLAPLMLGVWLAHAERQSHPVLNWMKAHADLTFFAGVATIYVPYLWTKEIWVLNFPACIGFALMVGAALTDSFALSKILNARWIVRLAQVSFGAYLFQEIPLFRAKFFAEHWKSNSHLEFAICVGTSIVLNFAIGAVVYYGFDRPFEKWRHRFFLKRKASVPQSKKLETGQIKAASAS